MAYGLSLQLVLCNLRWHFVPGIGLMDLLTDGEA